MTDACKRFNNPPAKLLRVWRIIYCTAAMGILVGEPLSHRADVPDAAGKFVELCDSMREAMARLHPLPVWIANDIKIGFCNTISDIWDKKSRQNPANLLDVTALLCASAAFEMKQLPDSGPVVALLEAMQSKAEELRSALMTIHYDDGTKDPDDPADWNVLDATSRLEAYILDGAYLGKDVKRPASCYIVGNRFWVAAYSRQQARDHVAKRYGLVKQSVEGVSLFMKLDDGRTVSDLVKMATAIPQIVAMDGEWPLLESK